MTKSPEYEREFDCAECGRHIVRFGMSKDEFALCAECLALPGWFDDPTLRGIIDPAMLVPLRGRVEEE